MLTDFMVLQNDDFGLHRHTAGRGVSLYCFDYNRMVLAFISLEAIETRFRKRRLTSEVCSRLVDADLDAIATLISRKYQLDGAEAFTPEVGGRTFPLVFISTRDLNLIPPRPERETPIFVGDFDFMKV